MSTPTRAAIAAACSTYDDLDLQHNRKADTWTFRRGFFYTNGFTSTLYADKVMAALHAAGFDVFMIDHGEVWKDFKGGAPVRRQSHWFVTVKFY